MAVFLCLGAARAAPLCDEREALVALLAERWGEAPAAIALTASGRLLEVLAAPDGATWTIIATTPDGWACVVSSGTDWQARRPAPAGVGS